jgi:hypothetical protein
MASTKTTPVHISIHLHHFPSCRCMITWGHEHAGASRETYKNTRKGIVAVRGSGCLCEGSHHANSSSSGKPLELVRDGSVDLLSPHREDSMKVAGACPTPFIHANALRQAAPAASNGAAPLQKPFSASGEASVPPEGGMHAVQSLRGCGSGDELGAPDAEPAPSSLSLQGILAHKDAVITQLEAALSSSKRQVALLRGALEGEASSRGASGAYAQTLEALQEAAHRAETYRSHCEAVRRDYLRLQGLCALHRICCNE